MMYYTSHSEESGMEEDSNRSSDDEELPSGDVTDLKTTETPPVTQEDMNSENTAAEVMDNSE